MSNTGKKKFLEAGQIVGTHGVRGEVRIYSWCDSLAVLAGLSTIYFDEGKRAVKAASRTHKNLVIAKLDGIDSVQAAAALRDSIIWADRNDLELGENRFFVQDLIGLKVTDKDNGQEYGILSDISYTGANEVYHVRTPAGDRLIPAVPDAVERVDIEGGVVWVRTDIIKGLFDDED